MKKIFLIIILMLPLNLLSFDSFTEFGGYEVVRIDRLKQIDNEEGKLWFSSWGGIFGVNIDDFSDVFILDTEEYWNTIHLNYITEWTKDSKSTFYIGDNGQGLLTYNEESGYTLYDTLNSDLINDRVVDVALDQDEYLWIKTFHNNYQRFKDGKFDTFKWNDDYPGKHPGIWPGNSIIHKGEFYSYTMDSNLISWNGERWKDHNLVSPEGNDYAVFEFRVYDDILWMPGEDLILSYDGNSYDSIDIAQYYNENLDIYVADVAVDERNGNLWALVTVDSLNYEGGEGAWLLNKHYLLKIVDKKMEKMIFLNDPELIDNDEYNYFQSMVIDKYGKLYFGTNRSGLVVYDPSLSSVDIQVFVDKALILGKIKPNPLKFESELDFFCHPEHVGGIRFTLYDYMGREVRQYVGSHEYSPATARGTLRMDKAGLMNGLYFLNVRAGGESQTRPVIVE